MSANGNRYRYRPRSGDGVVAMARSAARRRRRLMMADVTAARTLERQATQSGSSLMADEARKLCVPRVREGVRWCRGTPRDGNGRDLFNLRVGGGTTYSRRMLEAHAA